MQFSLLVLKDLKVSVVTTCLQILHLVPSHDLQQLFFFSRGATLALRRMSLKLLALLNPIIGTFSKTIPSSLSGVNSKCISDSKVFKFWKHWMVCDTKSKPNFISNMLLFIWKFRTTKLSCLKDLSIANLSL